MIDISVLVEFDVFFFFNLLYYTCLFHFSPSLPFLIDFLFVQYSILRALSVEVFIHNHTNPIGPTTSLGCPVHHKADNSLGIH